MGRKEKKLKEGEPSVRFQDEPRPSAPGTERRPGASLAFSADARHYLGLHSQAPRTFPPVALKDFSPVVVTFKIRGYRLLYLDFRPLPLHAPTLPHFAIPVRFCKDVSVHYGIFLIILASRPSHRSPEGVGGANAFRSQGTGVAGTMHREFRLGNIARRLKTQSQRVSEHWL